MSKELSFHYDPSRSGLGQILGDLEQEVMEVLWQVGALAVRDIVERLPRKSAYSSVITVANRLVQKEVLEREKDGKTFIYAPKVSREELVAKASQSVLERVSEIAPPATVVNILGSVVSDDDEALAELERLIARERKKRGQA